MRFFESVKTSRSDGLQILCRHSKLRSLSQRCIQGHINAKVPARLYSAPYLTRTIIVTSYRKDVNSPSSSSSNPRPYVSISCWVSRIKLGLRSQVCQFLVNPKNTFTMACQIRLCTFAIIFLFIGGYVTLFGADARSLSGYQCKVCLSGRTGYMPCLHMMTFENRSVAITNTFSQKSGDSLCNLAEIPADIPRCVIHYEDGSKINPKLLGKISHDGNLCSTASLAPKSSFPTLTAE
ncbi:hypothetical protein J437_LFUL001513 [Ladona fulva]|uniref:Uncharacterized protein n=1 Tax=Ladona fulva TaxID=123851 RepID=A0A8K0NW28_LADFU|nr:hypothetical protein J437_LFUL001513 [Ladona fulva]